MTTAAPKARRRLSETVPVRVRLRATYDAAQTTDENRQHWAAADALSANAAHSPWVRATLRKRARYEFANNSYCKGILLTLANDVIGIGPRLQMLTGIPTLDNAIERGFGRWAQAIRLAEKLRCMRITLARDGEAFGIFTTNHRLPTPVKLDLKLIEADQIASPAISLTQRTDGIIFDDFGNPAGYQVLKEHPGEAFLSRLSLEAETLPADQVIHLFRLERPGQTRGVPEIAPALPLFAQLRRYTLAVIAAAETAADVAGVISTDSPPNGETDEIEPLESIEIDRRQFLTMPAGWDLNQLKSEQPCTTYGDFVERILNEIARCLNMPFNVAAANSAKYNYASGRLDHQIYHKSLRVDHDLIESDCIDRLLGAWLSEAQRIPGYLPARVPIDADHEWFWDGPEHVDPTKEANAQQTRLSNYTTTLAHEYAKQGRDWEKELRQRAKELALQRELKLPVNAAPGSPAQGSPAPGAPAAQPDEDDEEEKDE